MERIVPNRIYTLTLRFVLSIPASAWTYGPSPEDLRRHRIR
jgi:hypothetical protein